MNRTPRWMCQLIVRAVVGALLTSPLPVSLNGQAGQPPAQPASLVVRAARMIDPKTGDVMRNPVIVIRGERIVSVGSNAAAPSSARVIDLGNLTVPGLVDAHTHLLQNYRGELGGDDPNMLLTVTTMSTAKRALLGAKMGRENLEAGITTVRDVGNSGFSGDVALRDAINAGWVVGPRMRASTRAISAAGGQFGPIQPETQKLSDWRYRNAHCRRSGRVVHRACLQHPGRRAADDGAEGDLPGAHRLSGRLLRGCVRPGQPHAGPAAPAAAIEAGKFADIIAVEGDPLKDVKDLQRVRFVMKGGEVVRALEPRAP